MHIFLPIPLQYYRLHAPAASAVPAAAAAAATAAAAALYCCSATHLYFSCVAPIWTALVAVV